MENTDRNTSKITEYRLETLFPNNLRLFKTVTVSYSIINQIALSLQNFKDMDF